MDIHVDPVAGWEGPDLKLHQLKHLYEKVHNVTEGQYPYVLVGEKHTSVS